jgi:hypothetical protein
MSERPPHFDSAEPGKIAIHGQDFGDSVFSADGSDVEIEEQIPSRATLFRNHPQVAQMGTPGADEYQGR